MMKTKSALESATRQLRSIISTTSQTIIKLALSTPPNLGPYHLSSRDACTPNFYIPMVLFFPCPSASGHSHITKDNYCEHLKRSLAQTLTAYYPFAGRLSSSGTHVNCNDHGVEFVEARVNCSMSEILENPPKYSYDDDGSLGLLFPPGSVWDELNKNDNIFSSLMVAQLNHFNCGGIAMAVSITHIITDGCGLYTFLAHWAAVSSQSGKQVQPHYVSRPSDNLVMTPVRPLSLKKSWITRRFVFQNSSLASIKAMVPVENPTRVEVLTALLYKSSIAASHSGFSPSVIIQPADMRARLMVPVTAVGNFFWPYLIEVNYEGEAKLDALIKQIKKGKMELRDMDLSTMDDANILGLTITRYLKENYKIYLCSSLCNFPVNKVDFGWGKPIKASLADGGCLNSFHLIDTPSGDGIEAMVCFDEETMSRLKGMKKFLLQHQLRTDDMFILPCFVCWQKIRQQTHTTLHQ